MTTRTLTLGLALLVLMTPVMGQWFDISAYEEYCDANLISDYCTEAAYEGLIEDANNGNLGGRLFINEVAYSDEKVYEGSILIQDIDANVEVNGDYADITATYTLFNDADENVTVWPLPYWIPSDDVSITENGQSVETNEIYEWVSTFASKESKEITITYKDVVVGDIYGYNLNLFIDRELPVAQITPTGSFVMALPEGKKVKQCTPTGYSVAGNEVTWQKSDFVPLTNPFNDLICTWEDVPEQQPAKDDNTMMYVGGLLVLIVVFMLLRRK